MLILGLGFAGPAGLGWGRRLGLGWGALGLLRAGLSGLLGRCGGCSLGCSRCLGGGGGGVTAALNMQVAQNPSRKSPQTVVRAMLQLNLDLFREGTKPQGR